MLNAFGQQKIEKESDYLMAGYLASMKLQKTFEPIIHVMQGFV